MLQMKFKWETMCRRAAGAIMTLGVALTISALAQQRAQQTFRTPLDAVNTLVTAAEKGDDQALRQILGSDAENIIGSGDQSEDRDCLSTFVRKYREMHRLFQEADGTTVLYVGAENWPLPIPLVNRAGAWFFDTDAGKSEILYRRIGENEMKAIEACHELVDAQRQYRSASPGSVKQYAQRFVGNDGAHDALYWQANGSGAESPIGPLLAKAGIPGPGAQLPGRSAAFHGYYYRLLTAQGKHAKGGSKNYLVDGKMTGGFAFVAFPAEYKSSGVMTFIINNEGIVYEQDLGPPTSEIAQSMKEYNPDSSWRRTD